MGKRLIRAGLACWLVLSLTAAACAQGADGELSAAVRSGDLAGLERLLAAGADSGERDVWGKTPLMVAARRGDIVAAQLLLAAGADINAGDNWRRTPLIIAVQAGENWLADILIHRGADVNHRGNNGISALVAAAQRGNSAAAAMLVAAGARVDQPDSLGWTPLMWAAKRGDEELATLLMDAGADVNAADRLGRTVLAQAREAGYSQTMISLLSVRGAADVLAEPPAAGPVLPAHTADRIYSPMVAGRLMRGDPAAPITIVEYTDFQCPYCASAAATIDEVLALYPGKVRLVVKHYPLESHAAALPAARYFEAVARQDREAAWRFYRQIFRQQGGLKTGERFLRRQAADLGVDLARLEAALTDRSLTAAIAADIREADGLGFDGVPVILVNGRLLDGDQPLAVFRKAVEDALAAAGK
jgi:protein-disulfide isomerase